MPPPRRLSFAPLADDDLYEIARYTTERWGDEQTRKYVETIHAELGRLIEFPMAGRSIARLHPPVRVLVIGNYVAAYRTTETEIRILRIVHERRVTERLLRSL